MSTFTVFNTDTLVEDDSFKALTLNFLSLTSSTKQLTILQQQSIIQIVKLLSSAVFSTMKLSSWLDIQVILSQGDIANSLYIQLFTVVYSVIRPFSGSHLLSVNDSAVLVNIIYSVSSLLEGQGQSLLYCSSHFV